RARGAGAGVGCDFTPRDYRNREFGAQNRNDAGNADASSPKWERAAGVSVAGSDSDRDGYAGRVRDRTLRDLAQTDCRDLFDGRPTGMGPVPPQGCLRLASSPRHPILSHWGEEADASRSPPIQSPASLAEHQRSYVCSSCQVRPSRSMSATDADGPQVPAT